MITKLKSVILPTLILTLFLITAVSVSAGAAISETAKTELQAQDQAFLEESGLQVVSVGVLIASIIRIALSVLGIIFVILIIYAGLTWMTSAGNEEKITKAKNVMTAAIIGLAIVLLAYAITTFVIEKILEGMEMGGLSGSGSGGVSASE